jgi:uncharacterized protein (DUF1330 family)
MAIDLANGHDDLGAVLHRQSRWETNVTAYLIQTRLETLDQSELNAYSALARPTLAGRPVTSLVAYGPQETLEGTPSEGVVIFAFLTKEDALAWYESSDYAAAREHRARGARYQVTLVEGI